MTWAGKVAGSQPATPGYGTEDQDHPAHKAEPNEAAYESGDPSAWAEDVHPAPYPQGNPPSTPGYDVEDQDHPAHVAQPRNPKISPQDVRRQANLRAQVEARAARCIRIARAMLAGKRGVTASVVEDQALDFMDLPEASLRAMEARFAGGFMAADESEEVEEVEEKAAKKAKKAEDDEVEASDDEDADDVKPAAKKAKKAEDDEVEEVEEKAAKKAKAADDDDDDDDDSDEDDVEEKPAAKKATKADDDEDADDAPETKKEAALLKRLARLEARLSRIADQNDPKGPTLAPKPKSEDEARKTAEDESKDEEKSEEKPWDKAKKAARRMFVACGGTPDGFAMQDEWTGSPAVFDSADMDSDGIITEDEFVDVMACGPTAKVNAEDVEVLDPEVAADLAEAEAQAEGVMAEVEEVAPMAEEVEEVTEAGMFGLDEGAMASEDEDALLAEIFGGKKASDDEDADDEVEEKPAAKKAKKAEDDEEVEASDDADADDVEEKPAAKKAKAAEGEEDEVEEKPAAKKAASVRPQPRTASRGTKAVGAQTRVASDEVGDLSRLWESAPDVSGVFGK
jgi:hypothetical protein